MLGNYIIAGILMLVGTVVIFFTKETNPDRRIMLVLLGIMDVTILIIICMALLGIK